MMEDASENRYPFRLGTTSFIYRADYASNVRQLAPLVDEIELLLFESNNLPSLSDITELQALAQHNDITYNVHLPIDINLAADEPAVRRKSTNAIAKAMERVDPLIPTTHTLHLPFYSKEPDMDRVNAWQGRAMESMTLLLDQTGIAAHRISIETLDFSPTWIKPIIEKLDLSVCVDVGHLILHGFDLHKVLDLFKARTTILHLHGVAAGKDHLSLNHIEPDNCITISHYLKGFKGSVSIEVFDLVHLKSSLACFPGLMALGQIENEA